MKKITSQAYKKIRTVLLSLFLFNSAFANEAEINLFNKGSFDQIKLTNRDNPYVITFWSETCGYCMKELALLGKLLESTPNVKIVSVTTDPFLETATINRILSNKNLQKVEKWVFADHNAAPLYYDVDQKWYGELPFTYFFDKNNVMIKHKGTINKKELTKWFAEQRVAPK